LCTFSSKICCHINCFGKLSWKQNKNQIIQILLKYFIDRGNRHISNIGRQYKKYLKYASKTYGWWELTASLSAKSDVEHQRPPLNWTRTQLFTPNIEW
jgi:hypothetical protein